MTQTQAALAALLPKDLAQLACAYFATGSDSAYELACAGEGELCGLLDNDMANEVLYGACAEGYVELARLAIDRGADDWNGGLWHACYRGYIEIARLMIATGADAWNWFLHQACLGGHMELVQLMIAQGANDWNIGLEGACKGGHGALIQLMVACGATRCVACRKSLEEHLVGQAGPLEQAR